MLWRFVFFFILTFNLHLFAQLDTNAPWPMYNQNLKHTGQTDINILGPQKKPFKKWIFDTDGDIYGSPAIGPDGTVYIGSADGILYAVKDGTLKWKYSTGDPIYSSPAIGNDGTIYVGNDGGKLYAITNGELKWVFETNSYFRSSPAVGSDGTVYIGNYNGILYAITNGEVKWAYDTGSGIWYSSPAIGSDGTIYIANYAPALYAITNGQLKWSFSLDGWYTYSSPAIGPDNTVYIADYSGNSKLYAITNGSLKWSNSIGSYCQASPALDDDGTVYIGSGNGYLYAITNGQVKWSFKTNDDFNSSPAIGSDGTIYIGNENDYLYAITNGNVKWAIKLNFTFRYSTPSLDDNKTVYVGSYDKLYAIIEENEPVLVWSSNTGYSNDGVEPDNGYDGQFFRFEIKYIDIDNDPPSTNQVWVDLNDDGIYQEIEKFPMYYKSGTSYSNGIIYTNLIQAFNVGDGIINYKFHFTDQYGTPPLPTEQVSNHTFTVTNTNSSHRLTVTINKDYDCEFTSLTNQTVMAIRIWDSEGHTLTGFKIGNAGTMTQGKQIKDVKLWFDGNQNFVWDSTDTFVANLIWDGTSLWTNNNITFSTALSFPNVDFIVTVDLTNNFLKKSNKFIAYIPANGIRCSGGKTTPDNALTNNGSVKVGQYLFMRSLGSGVNYSSIALGDIDNDGDLDLIVSGYGGGYRLEKYINDGSGNLSGPYSFGTGVNDSSIALGDIDNDGDLDLIVSGSSWSGERLDYYTNNGTGNFALYSNIGTGVRSSSIALGDLNNDGSLDLIVTGYDSENNRRLDKYINDGNGNLSGPYSFGTGVGSSSIALGDIDNDSDLDLIVSGYGGSYRLDKYINDGNGNLSGPSNFGIGVDDSSIALGDIDNDGDLDLIVSGYGGGKQKLDKYINDGNGNLSGPSSFGTGVEYSSIALGDIDNDGDLDLIVSGYSGSYRLDKYINDGNGNLSGPYSFGTGVIHSSIAVGDVDNDGSLDLIVTGNDENWITHLDFYKNMEFVNNSAPLAPTGLSLTSVNGYWRMVWNSPLDDHTPSYGLQYHIAIGVTKSGVYDYISTNIDYPRGQANVGNVPVVKSNFYQSTISTQNKVYWKVCAIDTSFKYGSYSTESSNTNTVGHQLIVTKNTDINIVCSNSFENKTVMAIYMIDTYSHSLKSFKLGNASNAVQGADITNVKLWYDSNGNFRWDSGDGYIADLVWNGSFWSNGNINYSLAGGKNFVITVDFARTVDPWHGFKAYIPEGGVVCSSNTNAPSIAITNNGVTKMAEGFIGPFPYNNYGYNAASMVLGDIDQDSDLDLIVIGYYKGSKYLHKYINNGDGTFASPVSFGLGYDRGSIALVDLDNDGDLDLVVTGNRWSPTQNYLDKYINDGTGNFTRTPFGHKVFDSSIALGDIDNDGDLDLIVTGHDSTGSTTGRLDVYTNDGQGNLIGPTSFGNGVYNSSVVLGDMDNDGDLDLIVSGYNGSTYRLDYYTNKGAGNFSNPRPFGTGVGYSSIAVGDINNDGDLDLVVIGYNGSYHLIKYTNDGNGNFTGTAFGTEAGRGAVCLGDIDNDGDLDLVVSGRNSAAASSGGIRLDKYLNDGNGNFSGPYPFGRPLGENWWSCAVMGDIDNDNDLDLLVTGTSYPGAIIRLEKYINVEHLVNTPPQTPTGLTSTNVNGYWQFRWTAPSDDHTSQKLLRYKIAIGTNSSGIYDFSSTAIDYPRGQANIGNVCIVTGCFYQSKITNIKTVYWKVLAIDTSLKHSPYSAEAVAKYILVHNLTKLLDYPTIGLALSDADNGDHLQADPYVYREKVVIANFTNLILEATSFASNQIITNTIITPPAGSKFALKITNSKNVKFQGFVLKCATNGIVINNGNGNKVYNNYIISNSNDGIELLNTSANICMSNIIAYNSRGILINNSSSCTLFRNAIYHHNQEGILFNNGDNNSIINNTIVSNGLSGTYNSIEIDAASTGNLIKNSIVAHTKTGYGINVSGSATLIYSDIFNNTTGNINGSISYGTGCFTNETKWFSYNIYSSNFLYLTNDSPCIDAGDPTDPVPSNGGLRVDVGWKEFTLPYINISVSNFITNVMLNSTNSPVIPGAAVEYCIKVIINGNISTTNIILYDNISSFATYFTDYLGTGSGWTTEYSTNENPDQSYNSTDYTNILPPKDLIKWIRWKKSLENAGVKTFYFRIIIK